MPLSATCCSTWKIRPQGHQDTRKSISSIPLLIEGTLKSMRDPVEAPGVPDRLSMEVLGVTSHMESSAIKMSLIMATFNRASYLGRSLQTVLSQSLNPRDYEVIVVDNNSTDNTADTVEALQADHPNLRYVFERTPGLSHARNRGIAEAKGAILCFVDDDILADEGYLQNMLAAFETHPEVESVGGKVLVTSVAPIHPYLQGFEWLVTSADYGDEPFFFSDPKDGFPFGVSMAFRREVFQKYGLFNTEFGRKKGRLLAHEELDLFERILATPKSCLYQPKALVHHVLMPERFSILYAVRWHFWFGVSDGLLHSLRYSEAPMREWIIGRRPWFGEFRPLGAAFKKIKFANLLRSIYLLGFFWAKFWRCSSSAEERHTGNQTGKEGTGDL